MSRNRTSSPIGSSEIIFLSDCSTFVSWSMGYFRGLLKFPHFCSLFGARLNYFKSLWQLCIGYCMSWTPSFIFSLFLLSLFSFPKDLNCHTFKCMPFILGHSTFALVALNMQPSFSQHDPFQLQCYFLLLLFITPPVCPRCCTWILHGVGCISTIHESWWFSVSVPSSGQAKSWLFQFYHHDFCPPLRWALSENERGGLLGERSGIKNGQMKMGRWAEVNAVLRATLSLGLWPKTDPEWQKDRRGYLSCFSNQGFVSYLEK